MQVGECSIGVYSEQAAITRCATVERCAIEITIAALHQSGVNKTTIVITAEQIKIGECSAGSHFEHGAKPREELADSRATPRGCAIKIAILAKHQPAGRMSAVRII